MNFAFDYIINYFYCLSGFMPSYLSISHSAYLCTFGLAWETTCNYLVHNIYLLHHDVVSVNIPVLDFSHTEISSIRCASAMLSPIIILWAKETPAGHFQSVSPVTLVFLYCMSSICLSIRMNLISCDL